MIDPMGVRILDRDYLVACPPGTDTATFTAQTRGREVSRRDGWILFTVPH